MFPTEKQIVSQHVKDAPLETDLENYRNLSVVPSVPADDHYAVGVKAACI